MQIISRDMAQAMGLTRYYTGTPCKRGHDSERFTSSGGCCLCVVRKIPKLHRGPGTLVIAADISDPTVTAPDVLRASEILKSWAPAALAEAAKERKARELGLILGEIKMLEQQLHPEDPDDMPTGTALETACARLSELRRNAQSYEGVTPYHPLALSNQ